MSNALVYQGWLDNLKATSKENFIPFCKDFLKILERENPAKLANLKNELRQAIEILDVIGKKAIKELTPFYKRVKEVAIKEAKDESELKEINHYEKYIRDFQILDLDLVVVREKPYPFAFSIKSLSICLNVVLPLLVLKYLSLLSASDLVG